MSAGRAPSAGPLIGRIRTRFVPSAEGGARVAELLSASPDLRDAVDGSADARALLGAVAGSSPFLWTLARGDPDRLARLLGSDPAQAHRALLDGIAPALAGADEAAAMRVLRRARMQSALIVGLADLAGAWDGAETTMALSAFAETATTGALDLLVRNARAGGKLLPEDERPSAGITVIGMGKLGAGELNFSSDIDIVAFYDPQRAPLPPGTEPAPFYTRLVQRLVKLLNERTADGYVARVDLRLRPDPGSMPVAVSRLAAMRYYETVGQNWERAALVKARPVAGDRELGAAILADLSPFVWRRHLDFAAIADIHAMKRQIHAHRGHEVIAVDGHNVKLGRGGIREIEFFVQTQQLIAGGRNPALRMRDTAGALCGLADDGWITAEARDDLAEAYWFLRFVEHRLQMVDDMQTHELPTDARELERFARFCGYRSRDAFAEALMRRLLLVERHYARLFERAPPLASEEGSLVFTGKIDDPETLRTLRAMRFAQPERASEIVRGWHHGRYAAMQSPRARELLTELVPGLLSAFAGTGAPDEALLGFDRMLSHLAAGISLLSILRGNPSFLALFADLLGAAPRLAEIVGRRPRVLDALFDPLFFDELPSAAELRRRFERSLRQSASYEDLLNRARIVGQEQQTLVGVRLMAGTLNAEQAGLAFSRVADTAVGQMLEAVEAEIAAVHGHVPGGAAVLLGLGRLGSREMTATSDLDLILLYRHAPEATASDGARPLAPSAYYGRLVQRLVAALSAPTGEGVLYPVDLRLRPSGRAGPLAVHEDGFAAYHAGGEAWTWEHMALVRARPIAGAPAMMEEAMSAVAAILRMRRDRVRLARDVLAMRTLLEKEKGGRDPWDVKFAAGGLVDIEFLAQFLVLANAHDHPDIVGGGTLALIDRARTLDLLERADHEVLRRGLLLQHEVSQLSRLCMSEGAAGPPEGAAMRKLLARATGNPAFEALAVELRARQSQTRAVFLRMLADTAPPANGTVPPPC